MEQRKTVAVKRFIDFDVETEVSIIELEDGRIVKANMGDFLMSESELEKLKKHIPKMKKNVTGEELKQFIRSKLDS